jgi:hypothetical protein
LLIVSVFFPLGNDQRSSTTTTTTSKEQEDENDARSQEVVLSPGLEIRECPDTGGLELLLSLRHRINCFMDPNQKDEPPEEIADEDETGEFNTALLQTREQSLALGDAQTVMRRFNRTTTWVATALLSTLIVAAGVLVFQDNHPMTANNPEEARGKSGGLASEGSPESPSQAIGLNGKSPDQTTSGQLTSSDPGFSPEIDNPGVAPEANSGELPTTVSAWSGAQRDDSPRAIRPRSHNLRHRISLRSRAVDVKTRLIMLWHQSLARAEKSRGWTLFSYPHHARSKKVSYSIETSH